MKDKILTFVIGILVGAVITASVFLLCQKVNTNNNQMPNVEQSQMMEKPEVNEEHKKHNNMEDNSNKKERPSKANSSTGSNKN